MKKKTKTKIMTDGRKEIDPIELEFQVMNTPNVAFRAITSQTELRKWWAPRVIMSRNIVSQEEGRDMDMKLLTAEENRLVRYSWRGRDWSEDIPNTIITFEISDLGVSRDSTGEGISISILHDNWVDESERESQKRIWEQAVICLKDHLSGNDVKLWWNIEKSKDGYRPVNLGAIKQFLERLEKDSRGKSEKKQAAQNLLHICKEMDGQGSWYMKENGNEFELRFKDRKLFGVVKNGNLIIGWRDLEKILGDRLQDYANRLTVEQDVDLHIGKSQDKLPAYQLNPQFWVQWCLDIVQYGRTST